LNMNLVQSIFKLNKDQELFVKHAHIDYGHFEYSKDDRSNISSIQTLSGIINSPTLSDLSIHILENHTEEKFIIGDQPVVLCNWLLSSYKL
jgi:hypothetical protein